MNCDQSSVATSEVATLKLPGRSPGCLPVSTRIRLRKLDKWGLNVLHRACESGQVLQCLELLTQGADPNITTSGNHGYTSPLLLAAANGHLECVTLLLQWGADANATDEWGNTALYKAVGYNHLECMAVLLEHGADPDKGNKWGATPLQHAAIQGYERAAVLLANAGCDVSLPGELSLPPPLMCALQGGFWDISLLLARAGAPLMVPKAALGEEPYSVYMTRDGMSRRFVRCPGRMSALWYAMKGLREYISFQSTSDSSVGAAMEDKVIRTLLLLMLQGSNVDAPVVAELANMSDLHARTVHDIDPIQLLLQLLPLETATSEAAGILFQNLLDSDTYNPDLADLLLAAGYVPSKEVLQSVGDSELKNTLESKLCRNPRSLCDLSRLTIRKCFGISRDLLVLVPRLPLPPFLQEYIFLQHSVHIPKALC